MNISINLLLVLLVLNGSPVLGRLQEWNMAGSPDPVYGHSSIISHSSQSEMLVFGGWPADTLNLAMNSTRIFDLSSWQWQSVDIGSSSSGKVPVNRHYHSIAGKEGRWIMYGGYSGMQYLDDTWLFDEQSFQWFPVNFTSAGDQDLPSARAGHTLVSLSSSKKDSLEVLMFGGRSGDRFLNDMYLLSVNLSSLDSDGVYYASWKRIDAASPPSQRAFHTATIIGDFVYVFGGTDNGIDPVEDVTVHVYSVSKKQWQNPITTLSDYIDSTVGGAWGHQAQSVIVNEQTFIVFIGGYAADSFNPYVYTLSIDSGNNNKWNIQDLRELSRYDESSNVVARRNPSLSLFMDESGQQFLVELGGTTSSPLKDLDIIKISKRLYYTGDGYPFTRLESISAHITAAVMTPVDDFKKLVVIDGWGFNQQDSTLNLVQLIPLSNPNDQLSDPLVGQESDCFVESISETQISCYTAFRPNGNYLINLQMRNSGGLVKSESAHIQYKCDFDPDYTSVPIGVKDKFACIKKASIDNVTPLHGNVGSIITMTGSNLDPYSVQLLIDGEYCRTIVPKDDSQTELQCVLGAASARQNVDLSIIQTVSARLDDGQFITTKITPTTSHQFKFTFDLNVEALSLNQDTRTLQLYGEGFGDGHTFTDSINIEIISATGQVQLASTCQVDSYTTSEIRCIYNQLDIRNSSQVEISLFGLRQSTTSYPETRIKGKFCAFDQLLAVSNKTFGAINGSTCQTTTIKQVTQDDDVVGSGQVVLITSSSSVITKTISKTSATVVVPFIVRPILTQVPLNDPLLWYTVMPVSIVFGSAIFVIVTIFSVKRYLQKKQDYGTQEEKLKLIRHELESAWEIAGRGPISSGENLPTLCSSVRSSFSVASTQTDASTWTGERPNPFLPRLSYNV